MNKSVNVVMNINVNYLLTFLFLILALIGILGNLLVIISVRVDPNMRRSLTNRLIVHVGCCDLIILLFNLPDIIQFVSSINGNWLLNQISCKLIRSILVLAQYASVLTMCAVTIERFIGIVYPLRSKFLQEKKHVTLITLFVWLFSFVCASPNLIYLRVLSFPPSRRSCLLRYSEDSEEHRRIYIIYKSIESTIFYFIPLLIQIYSYIRISKQLFHVDQALYTSIKLNTKTNNQRTQIDRDDQDQHRTNRSDSKSLSITNISPKMSFKSRQVHRSHLSYSAFKSRRSVIKMLVVVVFIYFISFSPQVLLFILFDTNAIRPVPTFIQTPYFIAFTMLLVTISSASNPIVYAIFSSKFRFSFAKIIRQMCFCFRLKWNCFNHHRSRQQTNSHFKGISIQVKENNGQTR